MISVKGLFCLFCCFALLGIMSLFPVISKANASDYYVSNFSQLQSIMGTYSGGDPIHFTNDITDVTAPIAAISGKSLIIDAQGYNYTYADGSLGFSALSGTKEITLKNWGNAGNPVSGFYNTTTGGFASGNDISIINSYFSGNGAYGSSAIPSGGVISISGQINLLISNSVMNNNSALNNGGVMYLKSSSGGKVDIINSTFNNNSILGAGTSTSYGSVIRAEGTNQTSPLTVNIVGSSFLNNTNHSLRSAYGGVLSAAKFVNILVENSSFIGTTISGSNSSSVNGGVFTMPGNSVIINSRFENNTALGSNAVGWVISYDGTSLMILADGGNTIFTGNQAGGLKNDIYAKGNTIYLNSLLGNSITFASGISGNTTQKIYINSSGQTYTGYDGITKNAPTGGTINLDGNVSGIKLSLYDGTLKINSEGNLASTPNFSTSTLDLRGGILNLENSFIDSLTLQGLSSVSAAGIDFDVNLNTGESDHITVQNTMAAGQSLTINSINIIEDGDADSIQLFTTTNAPTLSGYTLYRRTFTNSYRYDLSPSATIKGTLDIVKELLVTETGLKAAVADTSSRRTFSMTGDETQTSSLGAMAGGDGASLNILGNGNKILGNGYDGISIGDNQSVTISTVTNYDNFSSNTDGGAFNNAGTLSIAGTSFTLNTSTGAGGVIYNTGSALIEDSLLFSDNSATSGGVFYNSGTLTINGATSFTDNTASDAGGAIYNSGSLVLNTANGDITFSNNTANGTDNDIYNSGTIDIYGVGNTISFAGGITGSGTINKNSGNTLFVSGDLSDFTGNFNHDLGTTTITGNFFNGTATITNGILNLGRALSANSVINLANTAILNITGSADITFADGTLTGGGNVNKTGTGILNLTGDYSGYSGLFTQTNGTTIASNNLFNSLNSIEGGTFEIATNSAFSSNSTMVVDAGATVNISASTNLDVLNGQVSGAGTVLKTGSGTVNLSGDFSTFTGNYIQTAGTTIIDLNNIVFANGTKQFNGGILQTTGGVLAYNVRLGSTASTQGEWQHLSDSSEVIDINSADLSFEGSGSTALFGAAANLDDGGVYNLTANIQNENNNTIAFENSDVHLGITDLTGNTTYSFTDSTLDLTSTATEDYTFSNLVLDNTKLNIDLTFSSPTTINTDTITATSSTGLFVLGDIKILQDAEEDVPVVYAEVLNGVNFTTATDILTITTTNHEYEVDTDEGQITLRMAGVALTLNAINSATGNRSFNFSSAGNYNTDSNLNPMGTGTFVVSGATNNPKDSILSAEFAGGGNGYLFNISSDNTNFTLQDLTVEDAVKTGNGSVLSIDNANSQALLSDLIVKNNQTTGNGGAISQSAGELTITSSSFKNNQATVNGGAISITNGRISGTSFSDNSAAYGGALYINNGGTVTLQGPSSFFDNTATTAGGAIYNAGTLNMDSSGGNIIFSDNSVGTTNNDITTTGTLNIKGAGNSISINAISGSGAINKTENNILNLTGNNNAYTGTFTQSGGTTNMAGNFFGGTNIINAGTLNWQTNDAYVYNLSVNGGALTVSNNGSLTIDGLSLISKAANLNIAAGSTLNNFGSVTFASGDAWNGTLNNSGTVTLDGFITVLGSESIYNSSHASSNLILQNASELTFTNTAPEAPYTLNSGSLTIGNGTNGSLVKLLENNTIGEGVTITLDAGNTLTVGADDGTNLGGNVFFNSGDEWSGLVQLMGGSLTYDDLAANGKLQASYGAINLNSGTLTLGTGSFINTSVNTAVAAGAELAISGGEIAFTDNIDTWNGNVTLSSGSLYLDAFTSNSKNGSLQQTGGGLYVQNASDIEFNNSNDNIAGGSVNVADTSVLTIGSNSVFNPSIINLTGAGTLRTGADSILNTTGTLNIDGGLVDLRNGTISTHTVGDITIGNSGANFAIDIKNAASDNLNISNLLAADTNGTINIAAFSLLEVPSASEISLAIFNATNTDTGISFVTTAPDVTTNTGTYALSSVGDGIYKLNLISTPAPSPDLYDNTVNAQNIGIIQRSITSSVMQKLNSNCPTAPLGKSSGDETHNRNIWIKAQRFEDKAKFNDFEDVDTEYALIMAGAKTDKIEHGNLNSTYSTYLGYIGGNQEYTDVKMKQNGGYLGLASSFDNYSNLFLGTTINAGFIRNHAKKSDGEDRYNNYWLAVALQIGYDFELTKNIILNTSLHGAYTHIFSENYTNSAGKEIRNSELGLWDFAPELKMSYKYDDRTKISFGGKYVLTADKGGDVIADNILLPNLSIDPYAEYGIELWKQFDDVNMYASLNRRDGGREGWNMSLGVEFKF